MFQRVTMLVGAPFKQIAASTAPNVGEFRDDDDDDVTLTFTGLRGRFTVFALQKL